MTEYLAISSRNSKSTGWKSKQGTKKWREILAIFIVVVFAIILLNGFFKTVSFARDIRSSKWDGDSPLILSVNANLNSLFLYSGESEQKAILILDRVESEFLAERDLGILVNGYVDAGDVDAQTFFSNFSKFPRLSTSTNLTQYDLFRLWWQLKGESVKDFKVFKISDYYVGEKLDYDLLRRDLVNFAQNESIAREHIKLAITNASGVAATLQIVSDQLSILGYDVVRVEDSQVPIDKCKIEATVVDSRLAIGLAHVLDCDIVGELAEHDSAINITLGRDTVTKYNK